MSVAFPTLLRPQYPASPEVLISALAWAAMPRNTATRNDGLIYERKSNKKTSFNIHSTKPSDMQAWEHSLQQAGVGSDMPEDFSALAETITEALYGTKPEEGVGSPAAPMGLAAALLQDSRGSLGVANPPNFARIFNAFFLLGMGEGGHASTHWFRIASRYSDKPLLTKIDAALYNYVLEKYIDGAKVKSWPPKNPIEENSTDIISLPDWWGDSSNGFDPRQTPFGWFANSWIRLCSEAWTDVLSPRKWTTWATTVLRHALGFCYLWEARFFSEVTAGILFPKLKPEEAARRACSMSRPLIPWLRGSISERDVKPGMRKLLSSALACRQFLMEAEKEAPLKDARKLETVIKHFRDKLDPARKDELRNRYAGRVEPKGYKNLEETVEYALVRRSAAEGDYYGLLNTVSGRFSHVEPAPEWVVVMTALSALSPSATLRLGDVMRSLKTLGLEPRMDFLAAELERAGLCAGAADGDEGIEINLGFGGQ